MYYYYYYYYRQCAQDHYPYTIQPGETLNYIAFRLKKSFPGVIATNPGIDAYKLRAGQVICIPACPPNHRPIIIQTGDTLYEISKEYGVTIDSILEANPS